MGAPVNNSIIYLIGHYGVGKYTIGKEITAATGAKLFDNHLANNVVFSLVGVEGAKTIPERIWNLIGVIREQAFLAIEEFTAPDASFVLTNCLIEGNPRDRAYFDRALALSQKRGSVFVPVILAASDEVHAIRVPSPDRAERFKMTDVAAANKKRMEYRLLDIDHPNRIDLDTSSIPSREAAQIIIDHTIRRAENGR
jgi:hypothetical protein